MAKASSSEIPVAHMQGNLLRKLEVEDACSYIHQVKYKFRNQPEVYDDFLAIMKDFMSGSIDRLDVIRSIIKLFRGHPELLSGFNTFLPFGYVIEVQPDGQGQLTLHGTVFEGGATSVPPSLTLVGPPTAGSMRPTPSTKSDSNHAESLLCFSRLTKTEPFEPPNSPLIYVTDSSRSNYSIEETSQVPSEFSENESNRAITTTYFYPTESFQSDHSSRETSPLYSDISDDESNVSPATTTIHRRQGFQSDHSRHAISALSFSGLFGKVPPH